MNETENWQIIDVCCAKVRSDAKLGAKELLIGKQIEADLEQRLTDALEALDEARIEAFFDVSRGENSCNP